MSGTDNNDRIARRAFGHVWFFNFPAFYAAAKFKAVRTDFGNLSE